MNTACQHPTPLRHRVRSLLMVMSALMLWPSLSYGQTSTHEGLYQVEMIVFSRNDDRGEEHWPNNLTLRYPNDWMVLNTANESDVSSENSQPAIFQKLPVAQRELNAQARRFVNNARYTLLFHEAWIQPISHKRNAKSIVIAGGEKFDDHYALEGSIKLSVATYIELQTNLWYSQFDPNIGQTPSRSWPELPLMPTPTEVNSDITLDAEFDLASALAAETAQLSGLGADNAVPQQQFITRQIIHIKAERDMRSKELHYVDHPVVGIIIQVTPISQ
jgi:hypothetical protein